MKLRSLTLGSAALAGTLLLAGTALAQQSPYNTNPTPEERVQTDHLNADAAARAQGDADRNAAAHDNYNAARSTYDQDRDAYEAQRAAYARDRARYDREHGAARRWDAFYGYSHFRDVIAMPRRDLIGLQVSTRGGNRVGRIRDVDSDNGRVTRVAVSLGHGDTAWIDADDLRFDPDSRTVMTDLRRDQVEGMAHMHYPRF